MGRIFITGSADGLGELAAKELIQHGHQVVLHARNAQRAQAAFNKLVGAEAYVWGDLSQVEETKKVAQQVNAMGKFTAVIHNAGVYQASSTDILAVNVLAPYILTCLIQKPERLIYLSSGMHLQGHYPMNKERLDQSPISYSDSKLLILILTKAVARKWPDVYANAVNPGWVPTKMGGKGAPDDLQKGYETQVWLSTSSEAKVSGGYFFHQKQVPFNIEAGQQSAQEKLLKQCADLTGISLS